jgi:predicted ATPase/DNA-binding winged helix-turn-helix (wHTH) protein
LTAAPPTAKAVPERAFSFGPFTLHRAQKQLLEGGQPVRLGSRALDILIALVERAGELVSKDELVAFAWPRTIVEESSLRVHVAALRKVLGDGQAGARYILNQPGRGYSFVAPVTRIQEQRDELVPPRADERFAPLPARLTRMIGRAEAVALLAAQLKFGRFVTLVGPGGIGKTTMALAIAEAQRAGFEHGVCFIDLAPIVNGPLIPSVLMAGLGLSPRVDGLDSLDAFIRERRMLIVFDNCEHLVDALTPLVEHLLRTAPALHVLATSREPMRAEGEWLHRLGALPAPPGAAPLTAQEAMRFPAVELFVERATASVDDFILSDRDAGVVGELCHRLDGNPLAIELAAARVDLFGVSGLSSQLDAHVLQLKGIRRDVPARHHSLSAMLAWSYQLLTDAERLILNRLAVFQGWFPLHAATEFVMSVDPQAPWRADDVFDGIANLAAKSLLTSDASGEVVQFRLLELTRAYALAQLDLQGLRPAMADRHAAHVLAMVQAAAANWPAVSKQSWYRAHLWLIDEMRAALAWAFTPQGDKLVGCTLTAALWTLITEVNPFDQPDALERAVAAVAALPDAPAALEIRLNIAFATKLDLVQGRTEEARAAHARALGLAEQAGSAELEAEALTGIVIATMALGDFVPAAVAVGRLADSARRSGNPILMLVADRLGSQVAHLSGDNARCRMLAERVLNHPVPRGPMGVASGGLDHRVSMRIMLSRTLWLEGFADQAANLADETLALASHEDTLAITQTFSLCACPIALWRGDAQHAAGRIAEFRSVAASHMSGGAWLPPSALIPWWVTESLDGVGNVLHREHLITVHGRFVTPQAVARAADGRAGWCAAELLRAEGERVWQAGAADAAEAAQRLFEQSLAIAVRQQALAWELRSATSLARLLTSLGREREAREVLAPVYQRFTEGFTTADLIAAAALLKQL